MQFLLNGRGNPYETMDVVLQIEDIEETENDALAKEYGVKVGYKLLTYSFCFSQGRGYQKVQGAQRGGS